MDCIVLIRVFANRAATLTILNYTMDHSPRQPHDRQVYLEEFHGRG